MKKQNFSINRYKALGTTGENEQNNNFQTFPNKK